MGYIDIIFTSVALSMDAAAISICKGLSIKKMSYKKSFIIATYFSIFQMFMPFIGYIFANTFSSAIVAVDHWIAFILLFIIGADMIRDSLSGNNEVDDKIDVKTMILLAIATSIDALVVGITFAFLNVNLLFAILVIGIITFTITFIGTRIGNKFGRKYENKATIFGGIVLIYIAIEILFEHLFT